MKIYQPGYFNVWLKLSSLRIFNEHAGNRIPYVFGCVTTGTVWKFLQWRDDTIFVDRGDYYSREIDKICGIFVDMVPEVESGCA